MHPNTFLRKFWRTEIRPEVFVAMSFAPEYEDRFKQVIEPAIEAITYHDEKLKAKRVDLSKSGDSILTDIIDGVAHSLMVLADVSIVGHDSKTSKSYRNGNVMYEVGLALASRHSSEVLLIRDDLESFLFDVSTVPHKHVNFVDRQAAKKAIGEEIVQRLREIDHLADARLQLAVASTTTQERDVLLEMAHLGPIDGLVFDTEGIGVVTALSRLLDKQLIRAHARLSNGKTVFGLTPLGRVLVAKLDNVVPTLHPDVIVSSRINASAPLTSASESSSSTLPQPPGTTAENR